MENTKYYVSYIEEQGNPFIEQNFTKLSPEVKRFITDGQGNYKIEPFYSIANYKYVKNLDELNRALPHNETLIIEIEEKDFDKVDQNHIYPVNDIKERIHIGSKTEIYPFELMKQVKNFEVVVFLQNEDGSYRLNDVVTIDGNIYERRENIQNEFGGMSDLYLRINNPEEAKKYQNLSMELTYIFPEKWMITQLPEYAMSNEESKGRSK